MNDLKREILNQVASGTITAEEGAARLQALETETAAPTPAPVVPSPTAPRSAARSVVVNTRFGNTEVIGDPSVDFAVAEGAHSAREEGDVMVIEQSPLSGETSFEFNRPYARISVPKFTFSGNLTVRMNPSLALRTKVQAGNLRITGVKGSVTTEVQAGNCQVDGFVGPVTLSVAAGNIDATGRLDGGASSVRCQMGEVKIRLDKGSNVRINARTTLGDVEVTGVKDRIVGSGSGTLDIDCTMGDCHVDVS